MATSPTAAPAAASQCMACCSDCACGSNCQCTESLCRCAASSILNSLQASSSYTAEYQVEMHCQSCVRMTTNILGAEADIDLNNNRAVCVVDSPEEADELLQEFEDVGLVASLTSLAPIQPGLAPATTGGGSCCANKKSSSSKKQKASATSPLNTASPASGACNSSRPAAPIDPLAPIDTTATTTPASSSSSTAVIELLIGGMTCSMCSQAITRTLQDFTGVCNVTVSLATNLAKVTFNPSATNLTDISQAIEDVGYTVEQVMDDSEQCHASSMQQLQESQQRQVQRMKHAFLLSLFGTIPITILTMIVPHILSSTNSVAIWLSSTVTIFHRQIQHESLILAFLATLVQVGSGWSFYKSAHYNILAGQLGMNVLVAVGTTASYSYAWMETLAGNSAHAFETSSVLISFVLIGQWMNSLAVRRTSDALTQLMQLQSKTAVRVSPDGNDEQVVDVNIIVPGDIVKVLRGASIPADGVVWRGEMTVDEAMITGESVPAFKTPGSLVLGGTVAVESDGTLVRVTGVGANTALAQIVTLVQEAQTRQVPIQSLADTISSIFVPTVCTMSVITYLVWYALCSTGIVPADWYADSDAATFSIMFSIACLVISCPCALGLATPTAVMVGTGVAAKHGVLMKGGETLELASKCTSVVFDKTGTLTMGLPIITDYIVVPRISQKKKKKSALKGDYLLWLFGSLERNSEHPLAEAVVSYATKQISTEFLNAKPLVQPNKFQALTGRGALGNIEDHVVAIGNRPFAIFHNMTISTQVEATMARLERQGKTAIMAAVDGEVVVVMGIADELKHDAGAALRYLQNELGVTVYLVTGDNARTAKAVSKQLGLHQDRVISEALPVAKVQQVKKLQRQGHIVAMVGDGINDSPALAQADIGISLGTGAQIAAEAADMVLVRGNAIGDVCTALHLSRAIFRRIQLNLFFSLVYNILGIPVAAGVLYPWIQVKLPPTLAALAMALSSLSVVSSSLLLKLYSPPKVEDPPSILRQLLRRISSIYLSDDHSSRDRSSRGNDLREPLLTASSTAAAGEDNVANNV